MGTEEQGRGKERRAGAESGKSTWTSVAEDTNKATVGWQEDGKGRVRRLDTEEIRGMERRAEKAQRRQESIRRTGLEHFTTDLGRGPVSCQVLWLLAGCVAALPNWRGPWNGLPLRSAERSFVRCSGVATLRNLVDFTGEGGVAF